jgi:osmotically inducible protein OsmC
MATYFKRSAEAVWTRRRQGRQRHARHAERGTFRPPYSAEMRLGEAKGTNPEELVAAAHAGCFNMA